MLNPEHPYVGLSVLPPIAGKRFWTLHCVQTAVRRRNQAPARGDIVSKSISWETGSGTIRGSELFRLLLTVPGVGEVTALTWLGEVCETKRFPNAKALAAFCGCDPSLKVSAGKVTAMVRRKGNAGMKRALIQAARMLLTRRSEAFGRWGFSIYKRRGKGGWFKAVGAVARRSVQALYWVHRKGEVFSYAQYELLPPYSGLRSGRFVRAFSRSARYASSQAPRLRPRGRFTAR